MYNKSICIKSLLLGLGAGIIITGIISLIFTAGSSTKPDKEEIMKYAKEYGLMTVAEDSGKVLTEPSPTAKTIEEQIKETKSKKEKSEVSTVDSAKTSQTPVPAQVYLNFTLSEGDTSEIVAYNLVKLKLINNEDEFLAPIGSRNLENRLQIGTYKFKQGISIDEIINTLIRSGE